MLEVSSLTSPIGVLAVGVRQGLLCALDLQGDAGSVVKQLQRRFGSTPAQELPDPGGVIGRLRAYFAGDLGALDAIGVDPGGTDFQRRVWTELRRITAGSTMSYSELARKIGAPQAVRAAAAANARNPIAIVIPCHRVVAANGDLWGYGGGLPRKRWLLAHEGVAFESGGQRVSGRQGRLFAPA